MNFHQFNDNTVPNSNNWNNVQPGDMVSTFHTSAYQFETCRRLILQGRPILVIGKEIVNDRDNAIIFTVLSRHGILTILKYDQDR